MRAVGTLWIQPPVSTGGWWVGKSGVPAKAGNQMGNQNGLKHSFYSKALTEINLNINNSINCFFDIKTFLATKKVEKTVIVSVKKFFLFFIANSAKNNYFHS